MFIEQPPQVGGLGIAWAVERPGLDTGGDHGRNREVYRCARILYENTCTPVVEPPPVSLDVTDSSQADYVAEASVRPRRVSVENLSVHTAGRITQIKPRSVPTIEKERESVDSSLGRRSAIPRGE